MTYEELRKTKEFQDIKANLLRILPLRKTDRVILLGEDCDVYRDFLKDSITECMDLNHAKDADVAVLVGVFPDLAELLASIRSKLKPEGYFVFLVPNKLGLTYWAGRKEDASGQYFAGIEGKSLSLSRKQWESILEEAGLEDYEFFYPYPDYKLPLCLYSDKLLPKKNELTRNIWNYDNKRAYLFDEGKGFETIIEEGLFGEFSNAFLIMPKNQIAYVKFSENRADCFSLYTELLKNQDGLEARKYAACPEAKDHIAGIEKIHDLLVELYEREGKLKVAGCQYEEEQSCMLFDFAEGESFEKKLDALLLKGETSEFLNTFDQFVALIGSGNQKNFVWTSAFANIFCSQKVNIENAKRLLQGQKALECTDIDAIPSNVIGNTLIDYEWTFDFPIPFSFLVYRCIRYYLDVDQTRVLGNTLNLYERYGINHRLLPLYEGMEDSFQAYVKGQITPLRDYYEQVNPGVLQVPSILKEAERELDENKLEYYFDYGQGILPENHEKIPFLNGRLTATIEIPEGVCAVRIDPGDRYCLCHVAEAYWEKEGLAQGHLVNGEALQDNFFAFKDMDPQLLYTRKNLQADRLKVSLEIYKILPEALELIHKSWEQMKQDKDFFEKQEARLEAALLEMKNIKGHKVWKLYDKYLDLRGRTSANGTLYSYIDGAYFDPKDGNFKLIGWFASNAPFGEVAQVYSGDKKLDFSMERTNRDDVRQVIKDIATVGDLGFEMTVPIDSDHIEEYQGLRLEILYGNGLSKTIYDLSQEDLKKEHLASMIEYFMDEEKTKKETVHLTGWTYSKKGLVQLKVLNAHGKEVETKILWKERPDVAREHKLEKGIKPGFVMTFPRKEVGDKAKLVMTVENSVRELDLDMKQVDLNGNYMLQYELAKKDKSYLEKHGKEQYERYLGDLLDKAETEYDYWFEKHRVKESQLQEQRQQVFTYQPKISICIPLYNTPLPFLKAILDSVVFQSYGNWELCLADGSTNDSVQEYVSQNYGKEERIHYMRLAENKGIAGNTNASLEMATGDFVMLSDHDDLLELDALYEIVSALNKDQSIEILYTDEDLTDETGEVFSSPRFKPDFDREMLCSINYICHIFMVKKSIIDQVGGFREEFDGAQDWDLILRCCEKTDHIHHIPKVLYHWRAHEASTAGNPESKSYAIEAGRKALEEHYKRLGMDTELVYTDIFIMFRTIMKVQGQPKISILIPNKDAKETLSNCLDSILTKSTYQNYEIIVIENNSTEEETFAYYKEIEARDSRIKVVYYDGDFNYSKINNFGAAQANGDYYLLLNNDTEVIEPSWMEEMLGYCQLEDVGICGAKLIYPDDTVQHCGVVVGMGGFAGHVLTNFKADDTGYFGWLKAIHQVSAVTAACLMIKKTSFDAIGGLTEEFKVALNDVDLCLKVRELGQKIVINPWARLYHYESKTRGSEESPEKKERFKGEIKRFRDRWADILQEGDPYYNPNLSLMYGDCRIRGNHEHFDIVEEIEKQ